ncbi:MAG: hypothetical protein H3Z52_10450 [archaeon]|nr:hypothetical protein [archaeon]MCP8321341.1 hypothetical protein [archaeon]
MLQKFPTLSEWHIDMQDNFYFFENILMHVQTGLELNIFGEELYSGKSTRLAKTNDSRVRASLRDAVTSVSEKYKHQLEKFKENWKNMERKLDQMHDKVMKIIDEVEVYEYLDGKCDYEERLDK